MIEKTVRDYLAEALAPVPVKLELPPDPPARILVIQKTGSGSADGLLTAAFALQSYGPSLYEASRLNEQAKAAAEGLTELGEIAGVRLNSDYPYPDTDTKRHRYQAVYDIYHY